MINMLEDAQGGIQTPTPVRFVPDEEMHLPSM